MKTVLRATGAALSGILCIRGAIANWKQAPYHGSPVRRGLHAQGSRDHFSPIVHNAHAQARLALQNRIEAAAIVANREHAAALYNSQPNDYDARAAMLNRIGDRLLRQTIEMLGQYLFMNENGIVTLETAIYMKQ